MNLKERTAGVLLHVTSLPGPHGIGDFGPSAYHFVDWLVAGGQKLWQWLPTAQVGVSYSPYYALSAFAGSPLMVALEPLVQRGWLAPPEPPPGGFGRGRVDFPRVVPWRMDQLRRAADGFRSCATAAEREAFTVWCEREESWLSNYALFMALEAAHEGKYWWDWPRALASREPQALKAARTAHADEIEVWKFAQWCFDWQCSELKAYATDCGVSLIGDIPIYVAPHSADVWGRPDLFQLGEDFQPTVIAGCPPDPIMTSGQHWGNPLYRWDRMEAEGFAWWVERTRRLLSQTHGFRIDHFRAFESYWEIPAETPEPRLGRWVKGPGEAVFHAISAALGPLPIVAEDLGFTIPPEVHALRDACGFPGMKILLYGFGGGADSEFLPHAYTRDVVAYTGNHDNDTARGFWNTGSPRDRAFAGAYLACTEHDVHWAMIRAVANSVANTVIYPMQDVLGLDEAHRMNVVGTVGSSNWSWRFDWDMVGPEPARVLGMIAAASGRGPYEKLGLGPAPTFSPPDDADTPSTK